MKSLLKIGLGIALLLLPCIVSAQEPLFRRYDSVDPGFRGNDAFRIAFWNVENLFDLVDDSLKNDDAFTPEGENHYTFGRYKKKSNGLAQTLLALGGDEPVEFIGLSEVENRWVLEGLTKFSPLKKANYEIIHEDSPDNRGIDVACIYRPDKFNVILYKYYRVIFPNDAARPTRDILYVKGRLPNNDTLHVFVNHWPSRYGGQFASEQGRAYVAGMVRQKVDSLNELYGNPNIVITGDFNDEPDDLSLIDHLRAKGSPSEAQDNDLVNLSYPIKYQFGSHSFAGEWGVLDHFIVSNALLQSDITATMPGWVGIFDAPWLLSKNAAGNSVTNRMYLGPAYQGGYSDHLPIFLDLKLEPQKKTGIP